MGRCGRCKTQLPDECFTRDRGGRSNTCKDCVRRYKKSLYTRRKSNPPTPPKNKLCTRCGATKDTAGFSRSTMSPDGLTAYCRDCQADTHRLRTFKIDSSQYKSMWDAQGGVCAVCKGSSVKRLAIDHCHQTGKIRGLLCTACNVGIGNLGDCPQLLRAAIEYLEKSK